jgi:hypothetical protein
MLLCCQSNPRKGNSAKPWVGAPSGAVAGMNKKRTRRRLWELVYAWEETGSISIILPVCRRLKEETLHTQPYDARAMSTGSLGTMMNSVRGGYGHRLEHRAQGATLLMIDAAITASVTRLVSSWMINRM